MKSENVGKYENVVVRNGKEVGINRYGLDYMVSIEQENFRLHSIIKEVREKIKEFCWDYDYETYSNMTSNEVKELAEILEKENI